MKTNSARQRKGRFLRLLRLHSGGFSLVELVVVIALMGIVSAIAVMHLRNNPLPVRVRAAAKKMVSDIQYAQDLAISTGRTVKVILDVERNRYFLKWGNDTFVENILGSGAFLIDFDDANFKGVTLTGTQLEGNILEFNSLGVPVSGGEEIQHETRVAELNAQVQIYITPYTGRLRIQY
ncbi:MAG TPA: type II secretion system protein GspH [Bacteroidetes bacterium]|nr:type II secretion system protein GspH [Bacteroidota bacterium]